ncbi:MAG: right-handed parallel beta-helix repeat-containing protein [Silicimonas sp.]|nr:right-handed parallel beta-helix repeat-containing protein [Silicimonas sp.]
MAAAVGVCLFAIAQPLAASPDWDLVGLRKQLTDLSAALREDEGLRTMSVPDLVAGLGVPELDGLETVSHSVALGNDPATLAWTDKRHAIAAMSQIYGGNDNLRTMSAGREGDTEALEIRAGVLTLDQLRPRMTARHLGRDRTTGADVLRVPLIVGRDATLRLNAGDVLKLSNNDGAFLVNFGRLEIVGGEISAFRNDDETSKEFAPFVTSIGSGTVHLSDATFRNLGFGFTAKYAGLSILSHPTMAPDQRNLIENSRFDNLVAVAIVGVRHVEVRGNRFFDTRRNPLLISGSPDAVVAGNLFSGATPTNAIRVANGSDHTKLLRNVILEGSRAGLLISSGSDNVLVEKNLVWRRNGGGIKLLNVRCGHVVMNLILDDKQKGVEVRNSRDAVISGNRIIGNDNAGVWVSGNTPENLTYVVGNLLRENGSGLSTASAGDIAMQGNDLSNQFPRFLDGDVTHQYRAIIDDLKGTRAVRLNSSGVETADRLRPDHCDL